MTQSVIVRDANEHNLRHVNVNIPRDSIVVITGVSGSGKSSLAFDTIFQEGQRRFLDSLSAYARQFIGNLKRPDVESVRGISPTISIDQKTINRNPRSTVGTVVEIMDYYRLLFARLADPHCPQCGKKIEAQSIDQIVDYLFAEKDSQSLIVMAPIVQERKGEYRKEIEDLKLKGYSRARVNGLIYRLEEIPLLKRYEKHTIEVIIDRLDIQKKHISRIREAIEGALRLTSGKMVSFLFNNTEYFIQSTELACASCAVSIPELEPRLFSFNDPLGQCSACKGLGRNYEFDVDLVVPNSDLSIEKGAFAVQKKDGDIIFSDYGWNELHDIANTMGFSLKTPWKKLSKTNQNAVLYGVKSKNLLGVIPVMQELWDRWHIHHFKKYMRDSVCSACKGSRLNSVANAVLFHGESLHHISQWSVADSLSFFNSLDYTEKEKRIGKEIFKEIFNRLSFLQAVGLGYLNISRSSATLSGGEAQRIRLAGAVGAGLQGVLYVLDEPSIGLHPKDNEQLLDILEYLRAQGNSLIVVEHDEETIRRADCVIDIGPGAGVKGGQVIATGSASDLEKNPKSLTGLYLSGKKKIEVPQDRKKITKDTPFLKVFGAKENNLKNIDVSIPLGGIFTVFTGVSGSGKSTLLNQIIRKELARHFHGSTEEPGLFDKIEGLEHIDKVIEIDQNPIGRTPRSNPVTYTKIFDTIRELFASLEESKVRGYTKSRFSFNVPGGRCEMCEGSGVKTVDMQIMPSVDIPCEFCEAKRFNEATLEVYYKGLNIYDVLDLSVSEACEFFKNIPKIIEPLQLLEDIGLGYLKLGQPSTTLSGGEAQRIKISSELRRPGTGKTLYLLDEPTTGLHFEDIQRLLDCLNRLRHLGNTLVVIEHNLDVIKQADWVIDLGPGAGNAGGNLVAVGSPEDIIQNKSSITGSFLSPILKGQSSAPQKMERSSVFEDHFSLDIQIKGARKHNLKNFDLTIPRHQLTVITGVSGSGKSSLAFHTLFAEGQRRFVETLSAYARRFLGRLDRGHVDSITGLAPAIAIDQGSASRSPRSTVATLTEIYDYFRIFWARLGQAHCVHCHTPLESYSIAEATHFILSNLKGKVIEVLLPLGLSEHKKEALLEMGYKLNRSKKQIQLDRFEILEKNKKRLSEAVERAYKEGEGKFIVETEFKKHYLFSLLDSCSTCGFHLEHKLEPKHFSFNTHWGACEKCYGLGELENQKTCDSCHGKRLKKEYLAVQINSKNISDISTLHIDEAIAWFSGLQFSEDQSKVSVPLLREIIGRLSFLQSVGLGYLGLSRTGDTLSGGEAQRIRLSGQIGSGLEGVLYVLDEPTVGLHQQDTQKLISTLYKLRDLGNTLVVVEHDLELISAADHLVDLGPGAGEYGGEIVALGSPKLLTQKKALKIFPKSATIPFLSKTESIVDTNTTKKLDTSKLHFYEFKNLNKNNLKNISVRIPKSKITVVSGVSGSGKSSLVLESILPILEKQFSPSKASKSNVLVVDQSPLSGTPRSTPASYTKALDPIRRLFAQMEQSKIKGFDMGRFSYNVARGRCSVCEGRAYISVAMHFLSDVWEPCEACQGKRYNEETLSVYFKGKNIADVLALRIDEACEFFKDQPKILRLLTPLCEVGLSYLRLGQSVTTLSGGEAQRVKLAGELSKASKTETVYLFDEPTTGLHLKDIQVLWNMFRRLSDNGHTVVIVEHHPDIIRLADWKIELGPEGGNLGGFLIKEGI
jgi:excinuclease ABC subunit A